MGGIAVQESNVGRLLVFASNLQRAHTFAELLEASALEAKRSVGYEHVWFMVADDENVSQLRLLHVSEQLELAWECAPTLEVAGDPFLEAITRSPVPVVVEDARTDPRTNKQLVEQLGNRTIVNLPLRLLDKPFGIFGVGTLGEEGCRPPTEQQLDYLAGMAAQLAIAAGRIRFLEAREQAAKQRLELERRLVQSQKLESLGLLAGGIAHDFNNLLTVIIASASLAQQDLASAAAQAELKSVLAAAGRARGLTSQLLTMSRTQPLQVKCCDLNAQVRRLMTLSRRVLPENIELLHVDPECALHIECDPSQLDQVFLNLLINARDAMPEGGKVTLELHRQAVDGSFFTSHPWAKPGPYVVLTVRDTGVGIREEVVHRIFEPFFTTKGPSEGSGLGLAVSYGIVQQHGGVLQVQSEVGVGTCFRLFLPEAEGTAESVEVPAIPQARGGNECVLVVEDDPPLRRVAVRTLRRAGYSVHAVANGDEACLYFEHSSCDVVLMDVVMPGLPCSEAIAQIRRKHPRLPVVLTSGYGGGANIREMVKTAGLPLLPKPYEPNELLAALRTALGIHPPSQVVAKPNRIKASLAG